MNITWIVFSWLLALMVLPGTLYLLVLTVWGSRACNIPRGQYQAGRLAVVVPAHNEAAGIAQTLQNLVRLAEADGDTEVIVVADNCTDDTAAIAQQCGARVIVRQDAVRRGKGYALDYAFGVLMQENFAAFVVVDADSQASPNFIQGLRQHFAHGAMAVQARYTVLNAAASARTKLAALALSAFNVLRPRARHAMGLSAGILGNGFALSRQVLEQVPYTAASVVEDLEYHLQLINAGIRVHFADDITIRGEMPTTGRGANTQRARWEGGRLRMLLDHGLPLLKGVLQGKWYLLEPLADLLLPPLGYYVLLLLLLCAMPVAMAQYLGVAGLLVVAMHVLVAARIGEIPVHELLRVLLHIPGYLLWKMRRVVSIVHAARRNGDWVRTERAIKLTEAE